MSNLNRSKILSAPGLFILYILGSSLVIIVYRLLFPGEASPLAYFSLEWRFIRGGINLIDLFPALALSAIVLPFGLQSNPPEKFAPFSPKFLRNLSPSILSAIVAAGIYALLFFLASPLILNYEADLRAQGRLWKISAEQARVYAIEGEWSEAQRLLDICESIWPGAAEIADLKTETYTQVQQIALRRDPLPQSEFPLRGSTDAKPLTATEAIMMAEIAFNEERYYDAHWLATLGGELAGQGNAESSVAARIASQAWNAVNSLEPNSQQIEAYKIYHVKRDAYRAFISNDWLQAYYQFRELLSLVPTDRDGLHYLGLSEQGLASMAFFIDEMELRTNPEGAIFSLPMLPENQTSGRMVMRFASLSVHPDSAYGVGLEIIAFDQAGNQLWRLNAPFSKILPYPQGAGPNIMILTRALDRTDRTARWEPVSQSFRSTPPLNAQLTLELDWNNFLILSEIRRGQDNLNIDELITASRIGPEYGYLSQVYEAELISRFAEPVMFLPILILVLTLGWRYRAAKKPKFIWVPMLGVLPLIFSGGVDFFRNCLGNFSVWAVIYMGFSATIIIVAGFALILFLLALIILASQHG